MTRTLIQTQFHEKAKTTAKSPMFILWQDFSRICIELNLELQCVGILKLAPNWFCTVNPWCGGHAFHHTQTHSPWLLVRATVAPMGGCFQKMIVQSPQYANDCGHFQVSVLKEKRPCTKYFQNMADSFLCIGASLGWLVSNMCDCSTDGSEWNSQQHHGTTHQTLWWSIMSCRLGQRNLITVWQIWIVWSLFFFFTHICMVKWIYTFIMCCDILIMITALGLME